MKLPQISSPTNTITESLPASSSNFRKSVGLMSKRNSIMENAVNDTQLKGLPTHISQTTHLDLFEDHSEVNKTSI